MALIIDAPMPKNCLSCPMKEHCSAFGKLHFNERLKMLDESIRADKCPIIGEIPDRHGRLIDADAIISKIERMVHPDDLTYTIAHGILKQIVEDAETIVEASNG